MKNGRKEKKIGWLRYSWGDRIFLAVVYGTVILITLVCLYPLYYTVIASFSDANDLYLGKVNFLPSGVTLKAYQMVLENKNIWRGYANTIYYTVAGTLFNLFLTVPAAYALSKKKMLGRSFLMTVFLITMYFGGGMIPTYIMMDKLDLVNTRAILIVAGGLSVYNTIVTRTFFQNNIPETLYEAARIDGANEFLIFGRMVIPLSKPIIAVITLYYAVSHWNSYFTAMIYISDKAKQPLQMVLRSILILNESLFNSALENGDVSNDVLLDLAEKAHLAITMKFALVFIASAPMLVMYPFIQKHFVKGIMVGSLKG